MTPRMPAVTARQVVRVAERLGFAFDRQKGSHAVYHRQHDNARLVIPKHGGRAIKPGTLAGILRDMGINAEQFRGLCQ